MSPAEHAGGVDIFGHLAEGADDGVLGLDVHIAEVIHAVALTGVADADLSGEYRTGNLIGDHLYFVVVDIPFVIGDDGGRELQTVVVERELDRRRGALQADLLGDVERGLIAEHGGLDVDILTTGINVDAAVVVGARQRHQRERHVGRTNHLDVTLGRLVLEADVETLVEHESARSFGVDGDDAEFAFLADQRLVAPHLSHVIELSGQHFLAFTLQSEQLCAVVDDGLDGALRFGDSLLRHLDCP